MLTVSQTAALLRTFDNILILTHVRPDGDTVGCAAALCAGLRSLGKTAYLLPNPELTDTTAPYFRPYEAPEGFTPDKVVYGHRHSEPVPGERQAICGAGGSGHRPPSLL